MATTIAIIGSGYMGSSLIGGLIHHGHDPSQLWATDLSIEKLEALYKNYPVHITTANEKAIEAADVVIFAIKPQFFAQTMKPLAELIGKHKPLVISIAAGIRIKDIRKWLQTEVAIVRAMPNTPALIGVGATALFAEQDVTEQQRQIADAILGAVGVVAWLPNEALMDVVTALSGSGPAYFFYMMEALETAAIELGLEKNTARLLILQTGLGSIKMAIEKGESLSELRQQVTSKAGTTEHAIAALEKAEVMLLFKKALQAAKERSETLATQWGETL